jgi:tRNA pseudouridine(38-40) synthase
MEREMFNVGLISPCNYGILQKIGWTRASRTDKRVSAVMNVISVKLHKIPDFNEDQMKEELNKKLPQDIRIFRVIEVSPSFDAKDNNNNREYHYILPSFCLEPKNLSKVITAEDNIDNFVGNYSFKISPEYHEKLKQICRFFKGTKKYHNYTKKLPFSEPSANRHIYELSCDEIVQFDNFEAIKFKIVGQSFLYNQIRKMLGAIVELCRDMKDISFLENSVMANKMDIAKAPAEGLYLYKVIFIKLD